MKTVIVDTPYGEVGCSVEHGTLAVNHYTWPIPKIRYAAARVKTLIIYAHGAWLTARKL